MNTYLDGARFMGTIQQEVRKIAAAILTMSGDWRAEVTVTYDGKTTTFSFDFPVK